MSRSLGVTAATLSRWREAFLVAGEAAPASKPGDGEMLQSERLKARLATLRRPSLHPVMADLDETGTPPGEGHCFQRLVSVASFADHIPLSTPAG